MTTITDCQRLQRAWFAALAQATGGRAFTTHGCDWVWLPARRELMLMFPTSVSPAGLRPGLAEGVRLGARTVGVWLNGAVRAHELAAFGFEPGWQPWWMSAPADAVTGFDSPGASITTDVPELSGAAAAELAVAGMAASGTGRSWHATARVQGEFAGSAYSFYDGSDNPRAVGGIFTMEVLPRFRRHGLGTALLAAVARQAAAAGARELALNATPEGYRLYSRRGFQLLGRGQTWWLSLLR